MKPKSYLVPALCKALPCCSHHAPDKSQSPPDDMIVTPGSLPLTPSCSLWAAPGLVCSDGSRRAPSGACTCSSFPPKCCSPALRVANASLPIHLVFTHQHHETLPVPFPGLYFLPLLLSIYITSHLLFVYSTDWLSPVERQFQGHSLCSMHWYTRSDWNSVGHCVVTP